MISKLFLVGLLARFFYLMAGFITALGIGILIVDHSSIWPLFAIAINCAIFGLLLDVFFELGKKIVRIETDQTYVRNYVERLYTPRSVNPAPNDEADN